MKSLKSIPLAEPFFFGKEKFFLNDCIKSGWITNSGKYLNKFELEIKKITKAKYCCALINGSSSLQLALRALNPQTSDEILVPSITFVASTKLKIGTSLGTDVLIRTNLPLRFLLVGMEEVGYVRYHTPRTTAA